MWSNSANDVTRRRFFRLLVLDLHELLPPYDTYLPTRSLDLMTIRNRVYERYYRSLEHFLEDVGLVFSNCRAYNKPDTEYVACANKLTAFVAARARALQAATATPVVQQQRNTSSSSPQ